MKKKTGRPKLYVRRPAMLRPGQDKIIKQVASCMDKSYQEILRALLDLGIDTHATDGETQRTP